MRKDIFELEAAGFTETEELPVLVVPAAKSEIRSNPALAWHAKSDEESFDRAYRVGASYATLSAERYTDLPKVGLNPQNRYNTPTGLYWYPLGKTAYFAIDRPYRITAKLQGMGLDLGSVSEDSIEDLTELLIDIFGFELSIEEISRNSAFFMKYDKDGERRDEQGRLAALWWAITRHASRTIAHYWDRNKQASWTSVFRALGIDFVYDPGFGVIHEAEPTQIVSFTHNSNVLQDVRIDSQDDSDSRPSGIAFKFLEKRNKHILLTADFQKREYQKQEFSEQSTIVLAGGQFETEKNFEILKIQERYILVYHAQSQKLYYIRRLKDWSVFIGGSYGISQYTLADAQEDAEEDLTHPGKAESDLVIYGLNLKELVIPDDVFNFKARYCTIDYLVTEQEHDAFPYSSSKDNAFMHCEIQSIYLRYKSDFVDFSFVNCSFQGTDFAGEDLSSFSFEDCSFENCTYNQYTVWPESFDPLDHHGLQDRSI